MHCSIGFVGVCFGGWPATAFDGQCNAPVSLNHYLINEMAGYGTQGIVQILLVSIPGQQSARGAVSIRLGESG
jgi:hypothetical protein